MDKQELMEQTQDKRQEIKEPMKEIIIPQDTSIDKTIQMAISKGIDLEKLEKVLLLRERIEANEARKAYHKAMSEFKSNPIKIEKDKKVGYSTSKGRVGYSHASLANVGDKITELLGNHGFSVSWPLQQNGKIVVTCKITHSMGHSEETSLNADADSTGSKNSIQAMGSTITYLERYTLLALTGLATHDTDDDGQSAVAEEKISENQVTIIRNLITELKMDEPKFLEYLAVENVESILKSNFSKAKIALEQKRRQVTK